jgi:hypothetical protein
LSKLPQTVPSKYQFQNLKEKQRSLRSGFPEHLGLRVHRALSWLGRAGQEDEDLDVRFLLLWIGFNAAYAEDVGAEFASDRQAFKSFFDDLVSLDGEQRIYNAIWYRFPHEIRNLLNSKYVFGPFWRFQNGVPGSDDWAEKLRDSQRLVGRAIAVKNSAQLLSVMFDRLYVLRNQLVHGGSTWNGSVNRHQVHDGAAVLNSLLPIFIDIMMDNPQRDWGRPYYPVVE